jgi:ATP-dependent RNA helicase RhlE
MTFTDLELDANILDAIASMGYTSPTPIQEKAIPLILQNKDLIGCAQTGTGKTGAFIIPLLQKIIQSNQKGIKAVIVVPTRELALQIDQQVDALSYYAPVSSIAIYGGNQPELFDNQRKSIQAGVDIIIATPGRLLSHLSLGYLDLSTSETFILDEADRMLEMGFIPDIKRILTHLPENRQNLLFSATMPFNIRQLANLFMHNPEQVNIAISKPAEGVKQLSYLVYESSKIRLLEFLLKNEEIQNMIIFASRKQDVNSIQQSLRKLGIESNFIHSDRSQEERNEVMRLFKAEKIKVLVATDIISRGIDIDGLSHVLNFDIPDDPADYVHRVGRTARADKKGTAITFIDQNNQARFKNIELLIEAEIEKLKTPDELGESPEYNPDLIVQDKKVFRNKSNNNGKKKFFKKPFKKREN